MLEKILEKLKELIFGKDLSEADLNAVLEGKAKGTGLNWRVSVSDLLQLLGIDNSLKNREALAEELDVKGEAGSAEKNEALRKAVLKRLAESGGNVPASLLD